MIRISQSFLITHLLFQGHPLLSLTVNTCDAVGNTPLHKAALRGQRQIVEALLEHGAAKNVPTKDEFFTPLHLACQYNHKDVSMLVILMVDRG